MRKVNVPSVRTTAAPETAESMRSVLAALAANTVIATAKGIAAALTGSAALFAETLHTVADAGNEVLLYVSVRRSTRPPDALHPFGHGPERYYWALLAAIGMFMVGGAVSIWEGVHALIDPPDLEAFWVGIGVLLVALVRSRYASSGVRRCGAACGCARCFGKPRIRASSRSTWRTRWTCWARRLRWLR